MRGNLQCIPGLVVEAQLRGVRPGTGTTWIKEELEYCEALLDADTPFLVRNLQSQDQKTFIDLEDPEGMDVAFMMVELGCAAPDKLSGIDTFHFHSNTRHNRVVLAVSLLILAAADQ